MDSSPIIIYILLAVIIIMLLINMLDLSCTMKKPLPLTFAEHATSNKVDPDLINRRLQQLQLKIRRNQAKLAALNKDSFVVPEHMTNVTESVNDRVSGADSTVKLLPTGGDANDAALFAQAQGLSEISTWGP